MAILGAPAPAGPWPRRLVKNDSNKQAVHDVWTIGTTMLYDIAVVLMIFGVVLVAAAWPPVTPARSHPPGHDPAARDGADAA